MQRFNFLQKISDFFNHKTTKLVISLVALFFIIRFSFIVLGTIKGVIIYDIYHQFDYNYQKNVVGNNLFTHSMLLYTPIFLSFITLFKRKISLVDFAIALLLSYMAIQNEWFDYIHNFIQNSFIFDKLKESGRTVINNQYTRIIFYILLIVGLLIQVLRKKTRTISKIMILIMTTSCLFTVTVFHVAIPMGMFKAVLKDKEQNQKFEIENYSPQEICKTRNCYNVYENGNLEIISEVEKTDFKQYDRILYKGIYIMNQQHLGTFSEAVAVNVGFLFDYDIITMKKEGDKYFTTVDNKSIRKFSRESEIMFSFLAIVAHFIWIFGTLILIEFHNYKFKKRAEKTLLEVKG